MKIAEFFAELGIKGSEKTVAALGSVKKGFGDLTSLSLEAKAGIIGAFYAFERLMTASGQAGTNLTNFTALTGLSAQSLQQWQYAARQAGVSGEELTGSLKGIQNSMTNMLLGKGNPEGLGLVANTVGFDEKRVRDTFYVLQKLQEFSQKVPADISNNLIKSFGVSEGVIAAMRRNAFQPSVFQNAPKYSDKEIGALDRANIAWGNLGQKIQMAIGHFNASHGTQLVKDLSTITNQVIRLVEALVKLSDRLKVFELLGKATQGWSLALETGAEAVEATKNVLSGGKDGDKGKKKFKEYIDDLDILFHRAPKEYLQQLLAPPPDILRKGNYPTPPPISSGNSQQSNVEVNQNLYFQHDGKDHKRTGDSTRKATQDAFRQLPQGQGS